MPVSRWVSSVARRRWRYRRILLKLSGGCFADDRLLDHAARQITQTANLKTEIAVVVGGGNILRGRDTETKPRNRKSRVLMDRVCADQSGMLATCINGNRLCAALAGKTETRHLCAITIPGFVDHYSVPLGRETLTQGRVLVLSGGTGNPFFSTDSAAALRAAELEAEALLKATDVAGVFSADPKKDEAARLYKKLSYEQALTERLAVMDMTAFAFCMERRIPIHIFDLRRRRSVVDIIKGKETGSYIC